VINFSYPKGYETNVSAALARGEYLGSIKVFKAIFKQDPNAVIICDRFHLGEYAYGPVKRGYPEWLAEKVFEIEDDILKEIGQKNIRLIIMGVSKPEVVMKRSDRPGEYLTELKEYTEVNKRYALAAGKTQLPYIVIQPDYLNVKQVLDRVVQFMVEEIDDNL
jgi:thymidylate kinase